MSENNSASTAALQKAAAALKAAREKIERLEKGQASEQEPIAIVGMACRFPGGADSLDNYWQLLNEGRSGVSQLSEQRQNYLPEVPKNTWGGWLDNIEKFDPGFFNMRGHEASYLDPQQRLLLEVSWEALEHAAIAPSSLIGTDTGVFVGISINDYAHLMEQEKFSHAGAYPVTGGWGGFGAGRLAYFLGVNGPCMSTDGLCASSLVAVHTACDSIRSGNSSCAVVGGVNLILSSSSTNALTDTSALAPDGVCRAFDAGAAGFVRGEGCGVVILKSLSQAKKDNNRILALIKGSAVNHDGQSAGLTAPSSRAQVKLLRKALDNAKVKAEEVSYVETHGTGTPLGDPIEFEALDTVYGKRDGEREEQRACILGAAKSNLGHLESASGMAGLIKAILAMHNENIPKNLNFVTPNPQLDLSGSTMQFPTEAQAWPREDKPRLCGVSSFGMGGTNAHVVLQEPEEEQTISEEKSTTALPFVLSARSERSLLANAKKLSQYLGDNNAIKLDDLCHTLALGRDHFEQRAGFWAEDISQVKQILGAIAEDSTAAFAKGKKARRGKFSFVFAFGNCEQTDFSFLHEHALFSTAFSKYENTLKEFFSPGSPSWNIASTAAAMATLKTIGVVPTRIRCDNSGMLVAAFMAEVFGFEDLCQLIQAQEKGDSELIHALQKLALNPPSIDIDGWGEQYDSIADIQQWRQRLDANFDVCASLSKEDSFACIVGDMEKDLQSNEQPKHGYLHLHSKDGGIDLNTFQTVLTSAYAHGVDIAWKEVLGEKFLSVSIPSYAFDREALWYK